MAIDRTFGAALNKALRGLEQAGVGPLAENPDWAPSLAYLAAVYRGRRPTTIRPLGGARRSSTDDAPIRWLDAEGQACESTRFAERAAAPIVLRRFLAPSDTRLWRVLALLRRGVPQATIGVATGIASWFLAEFGRAVALEGGGRDGRRHGSPTRPTARRCACWRRSSGPASAIASWPPWPASSPSAIRTARRTVGLAAGLRDGRHVRRRVRRRDALLLLDLRRRRLAARGAADRAAGRPGHRLRPGPDRAGDRVRLLRRAGRRHAPAPAAGTR